MDMISAADAVQIGIQKGTILGWLFAIAFGIAVGAFLFWVTALFTLMSTSRLAVPMTILVMAAGVFFAGWGGWELGHWFTR